MEDLIPILNEHGDMYLTGRIIGLIDSQPRTDYSQRSKAYAQGYSDGCVDTKEKPKTDWIPCEERLPSEEGCYLICDDKGNVYESTRRSTSCGLCWLVKPVTDKVIAWQPLPQP